MNILKIGDKVIYQEKPWVVHDLFHSFLILDNGTYRRHVYKEFWGQLKERKECVNFIGR